MKILLASLGVFALVWLALFAVGLFTWPDGEFGDY